MLTDRRFRVYIDEQGSRWRSTSNGLPQESILALILFYMYTISRQQTIKDSDMQMILLQQFKMQTSHNVGIYFGTRSGANWANTSKSGNWDQIQIKGRSLCFIQYTNDWCKNNCTIWGNTAKKTTQNFSDILGLHRSIHLLTTNTQAM